MVRIDGIEYSGDTTVKQIVPSDFTVYFTAELDVQDYYDLYYYDLYNDTTDKGFVLTWTCNPFDWAWSEWAEPSDGTCRQQKTLTSNQSIEINLGLELTELIGPVVEFRRPELCSKSSYIASDCM